jgi:hypothetical protein
MHLPCCLKVGKDKTDHIEIHGKVEWMVWLRTHGEEGFALAEVRKRNQAMFQGQKHTSCFGFKLSAGAECMSLAFFRALA